MPPDHRTKTPKVRRDKLFMWLRIYDAIEYSKASEEDVIPEFYGKQRKPSDPDWDSTRKKLKYDLKRARQMVKQDYLFLVPLDYLQEKSYFKDIRKEKADESPPSDLST
ncbi:hypothetical protein V8J88_17895 [Massilia sp. W12]|uniref:hypothetical protein n=2 Tax=Massilia sp. W12 TaxID=3126507 RepID=UPI0030CE7AA3